MALRTAEFCGLGVHHIHKAVAAAPHMLCQSIGRLIGGLKQHEIEAFPHRKYVPFLNLQLISAALLHIVNRIIRKGDRIVQITVFDHHQGGKNFRYACRDFLHVYILAKKNGTGIHIHHDPGLRLDACIRRPVRLCESRKGPQGQHQGQSGRQPNGTLHQNTSSHAPETGLPQFPSGLILFIKPFYPFTYSFLG